MTNQDNADFSLKEAIREIEVMAGLGSDLADPTRSISIGVTSPDFGDGKTTVATALAGSIARDYRSEVMLVDADFRTHSIGQDFGLTSGQGLSEVLEGRQQLQNVTHRIGSTAMSIVTAGELPTDPARLARSEHLVTLVENMKTVSKYVVIDLPAALHSMDTPVLARRCDGIIVVVRYGHTTKSDLDRTLHLLRDSNVFGVVLNRQRSSTPRWIERALSTR